MRFRLVRWSLGGAVFLIASGLTLRAAEITEKRDMPPETEKYDEGYPKYLENKQAMRDRVNAFRESKAKELQGKLDGVMEERKTKIDPLGEASVTVDENTISVKEPNSSEKAMGVDKLGDEYEINSIDYPDANKPYNHERWTLHATDFRFDMPQYIVDWGRFGFTERWFSFSFSVTNSTTKARDIAPTFCAVTDNGAFLWETGGLLPTRELADSSLHPLAGSRSAADASLLKDNVVPMESTADMVSSWLQDDGSLKLPAATEARAKFQPGQVRWGAAVWRNFDDHFTKLQIVVHGLSNAHRYELKQERVLVMNFSRNDDEFHVDRTPLKYLGKEWKYIWSWDQDIIVPIPADPKDAQIKDKTLTTPSGAQRLVWGFPYSFGNSTGSAQDVKLKEIRYLLNGADGKGVSIEVDGKKALVEIPVVDDGRSSIYKAQYLRETSLAQPANDTNRFVPDPDPTKVKEPDGAILKIDANNAKPLARVAVFDVNDIDWVNVYQQVEAQLGLQIEKDKLSAKRGAELAEKIKGGIGGLTGKDKEAAEKALAAIEKGSFPLYDPSKRLSDDVVTLKDGTVFVGEVTRDDDQVVQINAGEQGHQEFAKAGVDKVEKGEKAKIREQVLAAVAGSIDYAKKKKTVIATFSVDSGLSSGTHRIHRSYKQLGEVKEEWLKAWEELDKK